MAAATGASPTHAKSASRMIIALAIVFQAFAGHFCNAQMLNPYRNTAPWPLTLEEDNPLDPSWHLALEVSSPFSCKMKKGYKCASPASQAATFATATPGVPTTDGTQAQCQEYCDMLHAKKNANARGTGSACQWNEATGECFECSGSLSNPAKLVRDRGSIVKFHAGICEFSTDLAYESLAWLASNDNDDEWDGDGAMTGISKMALGAPHLGRSQVVVVPSRSQ